MKSLFDPELLKEYNHSIEKSSGGKPEIIITNGRQLNKISSIGTVRHEYIEDHVCKITSEGIEDITDFVDNL